jgi:hypothetical protein
MSQPAPAPEIDLREALEALQMPPECLRSWFEDVRSFCNQHGGRNRYSRLLDLMDECLEQLPCD